MRKYDVASIALLPALAGLASCTTTGGDYNMLLAEDYKTSAITRNAAGQRGWQVSDGEQTYFCEMAATKALNGPDEMIIFSSSGRMITANSQVYKNTLGVSSIDAAQWSDLEAGRPRAQDVGDCRLIKPSQS